MRPRGCASAQRHLRLRAVGPRTGPLPDRPRSPRCVSAVLGPRQRRPALGGLGDEGPGGRVRGHCHLPARPLLRQRRRATAPLLEPVLAYVRRGRRPGVAATTPARSPVAGRAPAADERCAVWRAAVGWTGFLAGGRLCRALCTPPHRGG